jgi:hypothetical protein
MLQFTKEMKKDSYNTMASDHWFLWQQEEVRADAMYAIQDHLKNQEGREVLNGSLEQTKWYVSEILAVEPSTQDMFHIERVENEVCA